MTFFSPKNTDFLGLTPVSSDTIALSKSYFKLRLNICERIPVKTLFFKSQKVVVSMALKPFTRLKFKDSPFVVVVFCCCFLFFLELLSIACLLSRATGSQNGF